MSKQIQAQAKMTPIEMGKQIVKLEQLRREVETKLKVLKDDLLQIMKDTDVLTIKTGSYTLSRKNYSRIKVIDDMAAAADLEARGIPVTTKVVLDMSVMTIPLKNLTKTEEIMGVEKIQTEYVSMLMKKEGDGK